MMHTATERLSMNNSVSAMVKVINTLTDSLYTMLNTSFESVSSFARTVWSGVTSWSAKLFVDVVVVKLTLLKKHIEDLYTSVISRGEKFLKEDVIPFLYNIEHKLISYMQQNQFFYNTFGRLVKGIVLFIKNFRNTILIA